MHVIRIDIRFKITNHDDTHAITSTPRAYRAAHLLTNQMMKNEKQGLKIFLLFLFKGLEI